MPARLVSVLLILASLLLFACQANESSTLEPGEIPYADAETAGFSVEGLHAITEDLQQALSKNETPGAVALILRDGYIVYEHAFGHRTLARKEAMTTDTIFRIYSMTKPITSVAAMMLWEEGAFSLDDPVGNYLPEFNDVKVAVFDESGDNIIDTVAPKRPVMVLDLFRHTAGHTYGIFGRMSPVKQMYLDADLTPDTFGGDLQQYVETIAKIPLIAHPGDKWAYSPSTSVIARMVEVISGQKFCDFLENRLFGPLDMRDTGFFIPPDKHDRMAQGIGYEMRGHYKELHDVSKPRKFQAGDVGLVSTARDYARFAQMMLNGGELDGVRILKPETVELMTSNHVGPDTDTSFEYSPGPGYGFGLGYSVRLDHGTSDFPGSAGEYGWGGLAGTIGRTDPQERLIIIFMVQDIPNIYFYRQKLRRLTYAALESRHNVVK
jgi:CubicO group peptidase (beta-lactamase class C family)